MEKRSSDTSGMRRKKRKRKVIESSSDEENPPNEAEPSCVPVSSEKEKTKKNDQVDAEPGLLQKDPEQTAAEVTAPEVPALNHPDQPLDLAPDHAPCADAPAMEAAPPEPKFTDEAAAAEEAPDPLEEPGSNASGARKRDSATKVLHAARAWLKAPARKNDALMLERCAAMSGLTKKEIVDFVEVNLNRKPGEWCFTVVDERIAAKKKEQEAIQVATGARTTCDLSPAEESVASPDEAKLEQLFVQSKKAPEVDKTSAQVAGQEIESQDRSEKPKAPGLDSGSETPKAPPVRRRSQPKTSLRGVRLEGANAGQVPELSCLEAHSSGPRKFAPLRPGTRAIRSTATLTAELSGSQPNPSRNCRHPNVSKGADCSMVCDVCGEELLYDGWRLELCDEDAPAAS